VVPLQLNEIEKRQLVAFLKALSPTMPNHVAIPAAVPSGLPVGGSDPILTPGSAGISGRVVTTGSVGLAGIVVEAYQQGGRALIGSKVICLGQDKKMGK
jgi:hypothetical protein